MKSSPRARWLFERLTAFLLCFSIGAAYELWKVIRPSRAAGVATFVAVSPIISTRDRQQTSLPPDSAPVKTYVRDYDVADLLKPFSSELAPIPPAPVGPTSGPVFVCIFSGASPFSNPVTERDRALEALAEFIDREFWSESVEPRIRPLAGRLVVVGTADNHHRVEALIRALKAAAKLNPDDTKPSDGRR